MSNEGRCPATPQLEFGFFGLALMHFRTLSYHDQTRRVEFTFMKRLTRFSRGQKHHDVYQTVALGSALGSK